MVRSLRATRSWTRRELAERAGLSERFLADVEGGSANPSVLRLLGLAQALQVPLSALLGDGAEGRPGDPVHIALLGLRGAGKSTVGPMLAQSLGRPFVELDARIEAATGLQLNEMFVMHGESYYRAAEKAALEHLLAGDPPSVVALGGGLVVEPATFALVRSRMRTVWLRAAPKDHWQRVLAQGDTRPMADNDRAFSDLRRILAEREPFYSMADVTVETSGVAVADVVVDLVARLRDLSIDTTRMSR